MKKRTLLAALPALLLFSCTSSTKPDTATEADTTAHDNHEMHDAQTNEIPEGAKVDPVCNMLEEDMAWTDMTFNGTDTVWFCSPVCKESYDKDPSKYPHTPG